MRQLLYFTACGLIQFITKIVSKAEIILLPCFENPISLFFVGMKWRPFIFRSYYLFTLF